MDGDLFPLVSLDYKMANVKQVRLLARGVKAWNAWMKSNGDAMVDLRGADLRNADLEGVKLFQADMRNANFTGANLMDAILPGANFSQATVWGADLSGAYLDGSNLEKSDFRGSALDEALITGANLRKANLGRAYLHRTNLTGAELTGANLRKASLWETVFADANLAGAVGLEACLHNRPSTLDHRTLAKSGPLPPTFLRGCGLPDAYLRRLPDLLRNTESFHSCFISYSHSDKRFAQRLHDFLQVRGIRCWLDEHELVPGDDIHDGVDRGIRLSDKVLLCCSQASLTSWWVDNEIAKAFAKEQALMKEHKNKVLALIPLDLDGYLFEGIWSSGKSSQVRERVAADFRGWRKNSAKFQKQVLNVIRALQVDGRRENKPPSSKR